MIVFDLAEPSKIPGVAEPWFLALNADVQLFPVMVAEDLMKAGPEIQAAVQKFS